MKRKIGLVVVLVLLVLMAGVLVAAGKRNMGWVVMDKLTLLQGGAIFNSEITADDGIDLNGSTLTLDTGSTLDVDGISLGTTTVTQGLVENVGGLPSVLTATVSYTPTSGAVFTVADGEIWLVHEALYVVGTNFDCTGDDCTFDLGDGDDADGLVNAADANMQAAFTDYTGGAAGWGGLDGSAPKGAYLVGGAHVYAPSGAAETIDFAVGGTSPAAGELTVYLVYTRVQ